MVYQNTHNPPGIGFSKILRWKLGFGPREQPRPVLVGADAPPPARQAPDLAAIHLPDPGTIQVTWIGHSTFLLQYQGRNFLTDPIFGNCLTPIPGFSLKRETPPGLTLPELPPIDDVLISHNHYDHLDAPTVKHLASVSARTRFWVPSGLGKWFRDKKIVPVQELAWGTSAKLGESAELHCVPAQHFSARGAFDRNRTHWCGWVLRLGEMNIYYAGDTGYNPDFRELGRRFGGMDLSLLPIGAYNPRWIMQSVHTDPVEAVKIHEDVRSRFSIGCHWGTFRLTDESLSEPPALLHHALTERGLSAKDFCVLSPGQTIALKSAVDATCPPLAPPGGGKMPAASACAGGFKP